jgi:DNA-binding transcriptional regulator YhcF (GntR family)/predicted GIY-YIG superfamily endonuclease
MTDALTTERTALYRLFDSDGNLLYVGITNNPEYRFGQHRRTKPWWPQVDHNEIRWFDSLEEAAEAEKVTIAAEQPTHNVSANALKIAKSAPPKKRTGYKQIADDLRRAILDGHFAPGARLPGQHQLMRDYDVAESTVRQALGVLKTEQLVSSRQGAGVFVRDLDANRTVSVAVDQPMAAAELLARYMSPSDLAALAHALAAKIQKQP